MTAPDRELTVEQFGEWIQQRHDADRRFEYIAGELVEVPPNPYVSRIAVLIAPFFNLYRFNNKTGHMTGADGGCWVAGERYTPDVAFISDARQPELARERYTPNPPDLAVEVISSDRADELDQLRVKVTNYLAAGTVVWVVKPAARAVEVQMSGQPVQPFYETDTLNGGRCCRGSRSRSQMFSRTSDWRTSLPHPRFESG